MAPMLRLLLMVAPGLRVASSAPWAKSTTWDAPTMLRELGALFSGGATTNQHIALLRDEVVRKDAFSVASPRFLNPRQFDITKCCTAVDIFVDEVEQQHCEATWVPGDPKRDIVKWMKDPALSAFHAKNRNEACIKIPYSACSMNYNWKKRDDYLRKIADWNNGLNWAITDLGDFALAETKPPVQMTNAYIGDGDSLVSFYRSDMAIVLKSSMPRGGDLPVCPAGGGYRCYASTPEIHLGVRSHFDISLPLLYDPWIHADRTKHFETLDLATLTAPPRPLLAFFQGMCLGDGVARLSMRKYNDPDNGFIISDTSHDWHEDLVAQYVYKYDYDKMMSRAKFGFAPAGQGMHSFRLGEVMRAGAVPIDLQIRRGDMVLPWEDVLDWSKFSIMAGIEDLPTLQATLRAISEEEFRRMQARSLSVVTMFFNRKHWMTIAFDILRRNVQVAVDQSGGKCGGGGGGARTGVNIVNPPPSAPIYVGMDLLAVNDALAEVDRLEKAEIAEVEREERVKLVELAKMRKLRGAKLP